MPTFEEVRNYPADQSNRKVRDHVLAIRHAIDFSRMEIPQIEWFVPGLIAPGLTTIAGQSKAGKSWFLLQLGLAVSAGGLFIGNLRCRRADVLYLALEDGNYRIKKRLSHLGMTLTRNLYIDTANKITPKNVNAFLDEMPTIEMLIIDTLGRYLENEGIKSNDYGEMTRAAGEMHTIAKERNIAVIACTHTRKEAAATDWLDGVMGSKALVAVSDTILKLTRKREETEGQLHVTGRDVQERVIEMEHAENWLWYDRNVEWTAEVKPYGEFAGFGG